MEIQHRSIPTSAPYHWVGRVKVTVLHSSSNLFKRMQPSFDFSNIIKAHLSVTKQFLTSIFIPNIPFLIRYFEMNTVLSSYPEMI